MPTQFDLVGAFNLPPEKAVEFFRSKGYAIGFDYKEVWAEANAKAFTVAGVMKTEVLQNIRAELDKALANGSTFQEFKNELIPQLKKAGYYGTGQITDPNTGEIVGKRLNARRLETIYRTNTASAYEAGRYQEQMANIDNRPYAEYIGILDNRIRPRHRAMSGRIFRLDDPIWSIIWPPNGYRCRCTTRTYTESDIGRKNLTPSSSKGKLIPVDQIINKAGETRPAIGYADPITGKTFLPDPGFGHNPGQNWAKPFTPPPNGNLPQSSRPVEPLPPAPAPAPKPPKTPPPPPSGPLPPNPPPAPPAPPPGSPPPGSRPPGSSPKPAPAPAPGPKSNPLPKTRRAGDVLPPLPVGPKVELPPLPPPGPPRPPAPNAQTEQLQQAFLRRFGANKAPAVHIDPTGHALPISNALFASGVAPITDPSRLPLLAQALAAPDEIWLNWAKSAAGEWVLNRRYVKALTSEQGSLPQAGLAVFDWRGDAWGGRVQFAPGDSTEAALAAWSDDVRTGFLAWKKNLD
jgi:SPP1 gp7 family putative phage head morphogenesis protein